VNLERQRSARLVGIGYTLTNKSINSSAKDIAFNDKSMQKWEPLETSFNIILSR